MERYMDETDIHLAKCESMLLYPSVTLTTCKTMLASPHIVT